MGEIWIWLKIIWLKQLTKCHQGKHLSIKVRWKKQDIKSTTYIRPCNIPYFKGKLQPDQFVDSLKTIEHELENHKNKWERKWNKIKTLKKMKYELTRKFLNIITKVTLFNCKICNRKLLSNMSSYQPPSTLEALLVVVPIQHKSNNINPKYKISLLK